MCPERTFVKRCRLRDYSRCALTLRAAVARAPAFSLAEGPSCRTRLVYVGGLTEVLIEAEICPYIFFEKYAGEGFEFIP